MKRLTYLANIIQTDKGTITGDKHGYTEKYNKFFEDVANRCYSENRKVKILEIGVFSGSSLYLYNRFFDKNCEIYAIDTDEKCLRINSENIHISLCDQGDRNQLQQYIESIGDIKFDIIIDDGNHRSEDQLVSISLLHKNLNENGYYIIEDLHGQSVAEEYNICKYEETCLYFLTFRNPSTYLTKEENEELLNDIKDIELYYISNDNGSVANCKHKSITSVITFKNTQ